MPDPNGVPYASAATTTTGSQLTVAAAGGFLDLKAGAHVTAYLTPGPTPLLAVPSLGTAPQGSGDVSDHVLAGDLYTDGVTYGGITPQNEIKGFYAGWV